MEESEPVGTTDTTYHVGQIIRVQLQVTEDSTPFEVQFPGNGLSLRTERDLRELIGSVRPEPELIVYGTHVVYGDVNVGDTVMLPGTNVLIEVNLPYCLHLPQGIQTAVNCPDVPGAHAVFRKIWTENAKGSSSHDFMSPDRALFHGPYKFNSPTLPQQPEKGPWPLVNAENMEYVDDTLGRLRYTNILIYLNLDIQMSELNTPDKNSSGLKRVEEIGLRIVNFALEHYRAITKEMHIEPLSGVEIVRIFCSDHNTGFLGVRFVNPVRSAMANRSGKDIESWAGSLELGKELPLYRRLLLNAEASLRKGQTLLSVVLAFQSLEIYIEQKLFAAYLRLGRSDEQARIELRKNWKVNDRLKKLCRDTTGSSIADDSTFWNEWTNDCKRLRDAGIHQGEVITTGGAARALELIEKCLQRLDLLSWP